MSSTLAHVRIEQPTLVLTKIGNLWALNGLCSGLGLKLGLLAIPILGGLNTRNQTVRSRINYENAKLNTENARLVVKSDVISAHNSYRDAKLNFEASKAHLDAAQLSFELESERFELGASDLVTYTQSNRNFINAQATFAQAKFTLLFQDILLQYAVGTLKFEDIQ